MGKNILILTSIYPGNDINKSFTPVVHYFSREWCKMDNKVIVVHNLAYYHIIFHFLANLFSKLIAYITGTNIPDSRKNNFDSYVLEGVQVYRLPIYKVFPRFKFSKKIIKNQTTAISEILEKNGFIPDIIVGHWENPQLELINALKNKYLNSITSIVFHHKVDFLLRLYKNNTLKMLEGIDVFGYRSMPIKNSFNKVIKTGKKQFMCYSGIPEKYTKDLVSKKFKNDLNSFLFVGVLIKRKYPSLIIDAIMNVYTNDFRLNFIGEGYESKRIKSKIKKNNISEHVYLSGRLSRDEVWKQMKESDCFIMISKNEAYGLVYLEAMAAGCITIAGKNEGFDGVIEDGYNGFLCEPGNVHELSEIIKRINNMSISQKQEISKNAIITASNLTNFKAADLYLKNLIK